MDFAGCGMWGAAGANASRAIMNQLVCTTALAHSHVQARTQEFASGFGHKISFCYPSFS